MWENDGENRDEVKNDYLICVSLCACESFSDFHFSYDGFLIFVVDICNSMLFKLCAFVYTLYAVHLNFS